MFAYIGLDPRLSSQEIEDLKSKPNYETAMSLIKKAEKKLNSGHLRTFSLKDNAVNGEVKASQKPLTYVTEVRLLM